MLNCNFMMSLIGCNIYKGITKTKFSGKYYKYNFMLTNYEYYNSFTLISWVTLMAFR